MKLDKQYQHQKIESRIYRKWERSGAFTPPKRGKVKNPFSIIMPPPNANGSLHIGNAMFVTLEDIMARFQRMKGKTTLMLPGADHAGILTQVVFERKLAKEGKTRFNLGRRKFFKECLKFTQQNKKAMYTQIKKIGASCDWTREKFTLDKDVSQQVIKTFVHLHKDGLIYRAERLVNWCPRCMTALSNLEVEYQEVQAKLYFIKYPLLKHSFLTDEQRFLIVATTRPETMLGDTAIAVNPEDNRYANFVGQKITLPLKDREISVIADKQVDPEFGTGVVKVTPAHDQNDFEIGKRHQLPSIRVIGFDNKMTEEAGRFAGLTPLKAREEILQELQSQDLLINAKRHIHQVGHCERCQTVIEPLVSLQWFVKIKPLAEPAIKAVKTKKISFIPKRFENQYFQWMNQIHDWCISRQLWWGHQLPAYYCGREGLSALQLAMNPELAKKTTAGCGQTIIGLTKRRKCPKCGRKNSLIQDPDTLDTWFSSSQWPYTTLGYPHKADFKNFYPTSVMETGYEILLLWVSRMVMLGLYQTGKVPFKTVYLHGMVRDAFGEKISKSKENAIDPLDVIEKFGADALRMALVVGASPGNDLSLGEAKIKGYRNFCNKLWNIARFIASHLPSQNHQIPFYSSRLKGLTKQDKIIIKKLNLLIKKTTKNFEDYKFSPAGEDIYQFIWHQLADKYLESTKKRLAEKDKTALSVLRHVLLNSLKLLHPFMPFVTEAIWEKMPRKYHHPLIISSWPKA